MKISDLQDDLLLPQLSISQCLDAVMTLMNSYLLMSHENSVAVCLCHPAGRYSALFGRRPQSN